MGEALIEPFFPFYYKDLLWSVSPVAISQDMEANLVQTTSALCQLGFLHNSQSQQGYLQLECDVNALRCGFVSSTPDWLRTVDNRCYHGSNGTLQYCQASIQFHWLAESLPMRSER